MSTDEELNAIRHKKMADMMGKDAAPAFPTEVINIATVDQFNELVNNHKEDLIIVDFWAEWCGPCKSFAPAFEALQKEFISQRVLFCKLNVDQNQAIAQQFQVSGIPTTLFIRGKKLVHRQVGMTPKNQFAQIVNSVIKKTAK